MKAEERERQIRDEGIKEGINEGRKEGRNEGKNAVRSGRCFRPIALAC